MSAPEIPSIDGEAWLLRQLAGLEIPPAAPDHSDEALLRCLAFLHLLYHYGPADRWAQLERFFAGFLPEYTTPDLFARESMRWFLEKRFMLHDVLLAQVCRRAAGGA